MRISVIVLVTVLLSTACFAMPFSWQRIDTMPEDFQRIESNWRSPGILIALASSGQLYRSDNYGDNWSVLPSPENQSVALIAPHTNKSQVWYCETVSESGYRFWRSEDSGHTWHFIGNLPGMMNYLAVAPHDSEYLLGVFPSADGSEHMLKKTKNFGETWTNVLTLPATPVKPFWHPTSPWAAYWDTYRTGDYGDTWSGISAKQCVAPGYDIPSSIYAATDPGLFSSRDDLLSWWPVLLEPTNFIRLNPRDPDQIMTGNVDRFRSGSNLIYFSADGGENFNDWSAGLPEKVDNMTFAADWLFFTCGEGVVYRYDERPGDIDGTQRVDGGDLVILSLAFGKLAGEPGYNVLADLNSDGAVDGMDLGILSSLWGHRFYYDEEEVPGDFPL